MTIEIRDAGCPTLGSLRESLPLRQAQGKL